MIAVAPLVRFIGYAIVLGGFIFISWQIHRTNGQIIKSQKALIAHLNHESAVQERLIENQREALKLKMLSESDEFITAAVRVLEAKIAERGPEDD